MFCAFARSLGLFLRSVLWLCLSRVLSSSCFCQPRCAFECSLFDCICAKVDMKDFLPTMINEDQWRGRSLSGDGVSNRGLKRLNQVDEEHARQRKASNSRKRVREDKDATKRRRPSQHTPRVPRAMIGKCTRRRSHL